MSDFAVDIVGLDEVQAHLAGAAAAMRQRLMAAVWGQAERLVEVVKYGKLEGQALHPRTRRLQRSIHSEAPTSGTGDIVARVGTDVEYAAYHEYGFTGTEQVREHLSTITQAFGRTLPTPVQVTIRAHSRQVNYPARSFLRSALAERKYDILAAVELATQGSLES